MRLAPRQASIDQREKPDSTEPMLAIEPTDSAVLKYRLYAIDRIISRVIAYAIITGVLAGVFAGLVLLATQVLPARGWLAPGR